MQIEGITLLELQRKTKKTKKFRELFVSIDFRRLKTPEIQRRRVAVHVCEPYNASRLPAGRAAFSPDAEELAECPEGGVFSYQAYDQTLQDFCGHFMPPHRTAAIQTAP